MHTKAHTRHTTYMHTHNTWRPWQTHRCTSMQYLLHLPGRGRPSACRSTPECETWQQHQGLCRYSATNKILKYMIFPICTQPCSNYSWSKGIQSGGSVHPPCDHMWSLPGLFSHPCQLWWLLVSFLQHHLKQLHCRRLQLHCLDSTEHTAVPSTAHMQHPHTAVVQSDQCIGVTSAILHPGKTLVWRMRLMMSTIWRSKMTSWL